MDKTLVILAAGMGSRYGGLKQVDTIGSNGESIIDFTIYDAIQAGFNKLVLIIRKEHEQLFEDNLVKRVKPFIKVEYAYQELTDIPSDVKIPADRQKPWGTTHALLACRNIIKNEPFIICNADDYYGKDAFKIVSEFFDNNKDSNTYCMAGYKIENTLSENGTVTRGICQKNSDNYLTHIKEMYEIKWNDTHNGVECIEDGKTQNLDLSSPVSMNFWGFNPTIFNKMKALFDEEIKTGVVNNPLKYEALLPNYVGKLVDGNMAKIKVLVSKDSWFGVTYKEDKPFVVEKIQSFKDQGLYPFDLWKK